MTEELKAVVKEEYLPKVHHLTNWISRRNITNLDEGFVKVQEADERVSIWVKKGYTISNVCYIGENPHAYGVLYVLIYGGK